jgi:hypothetical protein
MDVVMDQDIPKACQALQALVKIRIEDLLVGELLDDVSVVRRADPEFRAQNVLPMSKSSSAPRWSPRSTAHMSR